jgi:predicted lipoprotein with Yx(FWY)xxD motif
MNRWLAVGGVAAAVALAGCGSSSSSTSPSTGGTSSTPAAPASSGSSAPAGVAIKTAKTKIGTVLTDAAGKTLYFFAIDTKTTSNCNGACATFWPPVKGPAAASGTSLPGTFGVITRADGSKQASYDGHPLYTFTGDKAPGETTGNGKNLSGGLWFAITPAGGKPGSPGPQPSTSKSSSGGGGYGY